MDQRPKIYIAGPIANDPNYREKFDAAEEQLRAQGWRVLNPAKLPPDLDQSDYMPICLAMLERADAIYLLNGWTWSNGALIETMFARYQGKQIYTYFSEVRSK